MAVHKWKDVRRERFSEAHIREADAKIERELVEMNLKKLREVLGKTQEEVAAAADMTQSQMSKVEANHDHLLSTLRRTVEALGGELEVIARFEDRTVKLTGV